MPESNEFERLMKPLHEEREDAPLQSGGFKKLTIPFTKEGGDAHLLPDWRKVLTPMQVKEFVDLQKADFAKLPLLNQVRYYILKLKIHDPQSAEAMASALGSVEQKKESIDRIFPIFDEYLHGRYTLYYNGVAYGKGGTVIGQVGGDFRGIDDVSKEP